MKQSVCVIAFLLLSVAPLFAIQTDLIDDVIRMSRSGVSDEVIIDFVKARQEHFVASADDIIALKNAGVSKQVIGAVIGKAGETRAVATPASPTSSQPVEQTASTSPQTKEQPATSDPGECLTFDPPIALLFPWFGPLYPPELWDPYWYQPRLDIKSGPPVAKDRPDRRPMGDSPSHLLDRLGSRNSPAKGDRAPSRPAPTHGR